MNLEKCLEPHVNEWEEYIKPAFIESTIFDICMDIAKRGNRTNYTREFDLLYQYIEEHIEKFYPEKE